MKYSKIGVFDSGMGGLTVLKELLERIKGLDMVYFGDTARLPYGTKSPGVIRQYTLECSRFLVDKGIDMLVLACNTASAHAISVAREELGIPVMGVIDAGVRAAVSTGASRIGVIGTPATIRSNAYAEAIKALRPDVDIVSKACPLFVPLVEEGMLDDEVTEMVARRYLKDLISQGIETLLLGCTHYPLLKNVIQKVMGSGVNIVDSAATTARAVTRMVKGEYECKDSSDVVYYFTDLTQSYLKLGELVLGRPMENVEKVDLDGRLGGGSNG
ncbi:MAG: glutamate racemase [Deltaproteobacteria bacterium]|nr:MAG: glutamate racemase [Deltaproteobacteria bacterium]